MAVGGKVPFTLQVTVLDEGKAGKELRAGTEVDATEGHCLQLLPLAFSPAFLHHPEPPAQA